MRELLSCMLPRVVVGLALLCAGAQTIRAQEDAGQTLDRLREEMAAHPDRLDLMLAFGNAAAAAGKFDLALENFQKVLDNLETDSMEAGDLYLRIGETYRRKGDAEAARSEEPHV